MSLCPVSPPPHWASTPANEAKVLWKQCGPLTEKDALCSAAEFQSEWISGAEVAYLITACCLGWKWTMSLGISLPCLYIHPEIANITVLIQHKGKWVRLFIYFHTITPPLTCPCVLGICFYQYLFLVADTLNITSHRSHSERLHIKTIVTWILFLYQSWWCEVKKPLNFFFTKVSKIYHGDTGNTGVLFKN